MKKACSLAVLSVLVVVCAKQARAEGDQGASNPCGADAQKLCPDMKPGDGKWGACMKQNAAQLSQACKDFMASKKQGIKEKMESKAQEACAADTEKFCSGMKPGDGKWGPCMKQNQQSLSPSCKRFMGRMGRMGRWKKGRGKDSGQGGSGDQSSGQGGGGQSSDQGGGQNQSSD